MPAGRIRRDRKRDGAKKGRGEGYCLSSVLRKRGRGEVTTHDGTGKGR